MKSNRSGQLLIVTLMAALLVITAGCSSDKEKEELSVVHTFKAETMKVAPMELPSIRIFPGRVRSKVQVTLAAKMPGYVKEVPVQIGDEVKKGQLLVLVDDTDVKARIKALYEQKSAARGELSAIEAKYEYAKINFERFSRLFKEESATKDELDRARTQYLALKNQTNAIKAKIKAIDAQIKEARNQLSYLAIKAPIDGWIADRKVDPGTYVNPGIPLIKLDGKGAGFWFEAQIDDALIDNVRPRETVTVSIPALGMITKTQVVHVQRSSHPATNTFVLLADLDEPNLKSGLFGRVYVEVGKTTAIVLPMDVIVMRAGINGVYVVDENRMVHWRIVRLGKKWLKTSTGFLPVLQDIPPGPGDKRMFVTVLSGLSAGEEIISSNLSQAREGGRLEQ
ncbi:MAG: efflux RND transporter periplasmic adaptor subunit [Thermodesulfobacteria bacterium]|nr:efflux RND transporter periplasmic adaptor subunit [Thermodesulfobacteriota bacterium]